MTPAKKPSLDTLAGVVAQKLQDESSPPRSAPASRWIENGAAVVGVLVGAAYVVAVEIVPALLNRPHAQHGIPWGVVIIVGACVLPKTIGRATTGKLWERFAGRGG